MDMQNPFSYPNLISATFGDLTIEADLVTSERYPNYREPKTAIDDHWLRELFEENAAALGEKCGRQVGLALKSRLEELADDENSHDRFSYIWRPAIEDHPQNHQSPSITDTLIVALRDVTTAHLKNRNDEALIREFLKSKSHFVVRTGFYLINSYLDRFSDPFWETFKSDPQTFLLDNNYRHELYKFCETHFSNFSTELKDYLVDVIEDVKGDWRDDVDKRQMDAYVRLRWFTAIKGKGHARSDERYAHYKKLSEMEEDIEHPDLSSYTTTSWGHERPISPQDLMSKGTAAQIVAFLDEFNPKDKYGHSAEEGTGEVLRDAIKSKWNQEQISKMIHFFWAQRDGIDEQEEIRSRILAFWRVCFHKCKGHESENEKILSDLNLLAVFLKGIDAEQKSWLLQSVPYSEVHFHIGFFTEYLNHLADTNPLDVAEIFLTLLDHSIPTYKEETIQSIVEKIYKAGGREQAGRICDKYGRAGAEFLREIYEKFHRPQRAKARPMKGQLEKDGMEM